MNRFVWPLLAAIAAATGAAARAQETSTPVGPPELRDFTLPGTPARDPEPAPPPPAAETPPPQAAPAPAPDRSRATPPATSRPQPVRVEPLAPAPRDEPVPEPIAELPAEATPAIETPPPLPIPEPAPPAAIEIEPAEPAAPSSLWGLAAIVFGAAILFGLWKAGLMPSRRQQRNPGLSAQLGGSPALAAPPLPRAAEPAAIPSPGAAAAAMPAADPRPSIDIVFKPARAEATEAGASVQYELIVKNLGTATAGNVRIEARMFNAGRSQDGEVGAFFKAPIEGALVTRPFDIPARSQAKLSRVVGMERAEMRAFAVKGRSLFVPLVAFNVVYDRGDDGPGQTSRCYVVGLEKDVPTEKMGAFRLDLGPRIYRSVGQRQTDLARIA